MAKKVAVIGAGASGLAAIKCCLDEGLEPTCFERTDSIGGLWYFTEEVREGQACVMRSTVINTSKEMMCYSDFPIPKEFPNYMPHWDVLKYFNLYADNFGLKKHIKFNTEVNRLERASDFSNSGKWDLAVKEAGKDEECLTFDAVLVCTGHHAEKNVAQFPGMDKFKGRIVHTHDYKDARGMDGKRAVVVGIGNSGGDASVELSRVCTKVFLSTRTGSWIFNRVGNDGIPGDMLLSRTVLAIAAVLRKLFPNFWASSIKSRLNKRFDHKLFSLQPNYPPLSHHPTVNDELPNRIISGIVVVKPNIQEITETGVKFVDGTFEDNITTIVLATGYIFGFPFLEKDVIDVKENKIELFKYAFPPYLTKHTLAVIGCFQPLGAIMPISEMQCRLATRIFKEDVTLPAREEMWKDIRVKQRNMSLRYIPSKRHTIQVDYIPFMDELAELNGCKPDLGKLLLSDPQLAFRVYTGPCTPVQFRLMGPGSWQGARDAIMSTWKRMRFPLQTRPMQLKEDGALSKVYIIVTVLIALFIYMLFGKG